MSHSLGQLKALVTFSAIIFCFHRPLLKPEDAKLWCRKKILLLKFKNWWVTFNSNPHTFFGPTVFFYSCSNKFNPLINLYTVVAIGHGCRSCMFPITSYLAICPLQLFESYLLSSINTAFQQSEKPSQHSYLRVSQ